MGEKVPTIDLNAPLAVETSFVPEDNETVAKSLGWFYAGTAILITLIGLAVGIGYLYYVSSIKYQAPKIEEVKPTSTPITLDRASLKVEVLNGSGKAGKAGEKARELEKLGYKDIKIGNADKRYATSIVYLSEKAKIFKDDFVDIKQAVLDKAGVDIRLVLGAGTSPKN